MKAGKWIVKIILAGFICGFQSGIYAADSKWSVGASVGASETDLSNLSIDNSFGADGFSTTTTFSDTESSWNVFVGYKYSINLGLEVGYTSFGEFGYSGTKTGPAGTYTGTREITGFYGAIVGYFPLSETLSLMGKFGMASWDEDGSISNASMQNSAFVRGDSSSDLLIGAGIEYKITDSISFRGDLMQLKAPENIHMWSAGLIYNF
ncbi:MAG: outer membrane beta-barrel protein [Gammaproteobacteria bacterium]|nr:outer membrane beta-barrel protein [Gammaproteobacteria bacterium]MCK5092862.1 outer membrane beta-barrel protein [Gammaproteobacteria bacterium]